MEYLFAAISILQSSIKTLTVDDILHRNLEISILQSSIKTFDCKATGAPLELFQFYTVRLKLQKRGFARKLSR